SLITQTLHSGTIFADIQAMLALELICKIIDYDSVKISSTQVSVTIGSLYLKYSVAELQDRHVKCTATQVVDGNLFISLLGFVQSIGKSCSSRLVDNTSYLEAGNLTSIFGSLALAVIKIGRNSNNCLGNRLAQETLGICLELAKCHGTDLFGT